MQRRSLAPNAVTFSSALGACPTGEFGSNRTRLTQGVIGSVLE